MPKSIFNNFPGGFKKSLVHNDRTIVDSQKPLYPPKVQDNKKSAAKLQHFLHNLNTNK
jgi:hypothetical protein